MSKSWTIVGYTYQADNYCPECTAFQMAAGGAPQRRDYEDVESYLDRAAGWLKVDRHNEYGFDSDVFPKVVFADQANGELCGTCHLPIATY